VVAAFKRDAANPRYRDWDDLIENYCMLSAAPVGRYLLDLHGESTAGYPYSDALCNALQVINHLQDCKDDYRDLDRVYLPQEWMKAAGIDGGHLDAAHASPGLRAVLDRCLAGTETLLAEARRLPGALSDRRLGLESSVIVAIAVRLTALLRARDPVAERVELNRAQFISCGVIGVIRGLAG